MRQFHQSNETVVVINTSGTKLKLELLNYDIIQQGITVCSNMLIIKRNSENQIKTSLLVMSADQDGQCPDNNCATYMYIINMNPPG